VESMRVVSRVLWLLPLAVALGCGAHQDPPWRKIPPAPPEAHAGAAYPVPPPPFSKASIFPCSDCHSDPDMELNTERRELEEHTRIDLHHGDRERWCFDCHNPENRDMLRLASGSLVSFEQSYKLCGQCHGDKYRDWRAGVHGKRTGSWNGEKRYLLCAHCHDPHVPKIKSQKPLPPPVHPAAIR
jgi:hypothetical protein